MQITAETIITGIGALGFGGFLGQLAKNRGEFQARRDDDLTDFRKSLMVEIDQLKAEHRIEMDQVKAESKENKDENERQAKVIEGLQQRLGKSEREYATHRAAVRVMIMQMRNKDPSWEKLAQALSVADHEVDKLISQGEVQALATKRVLVIDDSPDAVNMIQLCLRHSGYDVESAEGGAEGIGMFVESAKRNKRFDLVICDYTMPLMNGAQVVTALRKYDGKTPVVFLTGHPEGVTDDLAGNEFGCEVWSKPIDCNLLSSKVAEAISRN